MAQAISSCYALNAFKDFTDQINLKYTKSKLKLGKFNILYININSILNKLDDLEIIIEQVLRENSGNLIHIIALTEVRIHEHVTQYFNMSNYVSFYCTRHDGYGGCALFVHESISCALTEKKSCNNIEILTIRLIEMSISVSVIYKQPTVRNDVFIEFLSHQLENRKDMIVVGDMNINLLEDSISVKKYVDSLIANNCVVLNDIQLSSATRSAARTINGTTSHSNTIIDHFFTDCLNFSYEVSQFDNPISDHKVLIII